MNRKLERTCNRYLKRWAPTLSPRTVEAKQSTFSLFIRCLRKNHSEITCWSQLRRSPHIEDWLHSIHSLKWSSRRAKISMMKVFLDDIVNGKWPEAPSPGLLTYEDYPPSERVLPRALSPALDQAVQEALAQANTLPAMGLRLLRMTGMRVGEMRNLPLNALETTDDINYWLRVPPGKTYSERIIPLSPEATSLVKEILAFRCSRKQRRLRRGRGKYLMINQFGEHLTTQTYWQNLVNLTAHIKTTERIHPHRLRHMFATEMARADMPVPVLMKILGHETPKMTMRYVEVAHSDLRKAYDQALEKLNLISTIEVPEQAAGYDEVVSSTTPCDLMNILITRLESVRRDTDDPTQTKRLLRFTKRMRKARGELQKIT